MTFQQPVISRNARGEDEDTWNDNQWLDTVAARVRPLSGRELEKAHQINSEATWEILIRYPQGINVTPNMRAKVIDGPTLDIVSVIDTDYRHRELVILAKQHA